jgi:hypothetical protein
VGNDDEHFVNQIMREHAMGLIQSGAASPLDECLYRLADAENYSTAAHPARLGKKKTGSSSILNKLIRYHSGRKKSFSG